PRIVVVGAGAAGLGAAIKLNHLGFKNIIIVEACQQVGGRIAKANIGNAWVDTGAQYIHGASEKNPVYCLLKKSGLLSQVPEDGKSLFYRCNGHKVDEDFSKYVYEAGERIIRYYGNIGKSIGEHFAEKAQELIDMHQADEKMLVQSILSLVGKQFLLDIGASDLHNVSLASWQYYINMGEDLNVEGLMFQLVENLMEDFPKECLLLSKAVSKIDWDGSFSDKEGHVYPVCVVCEDGEEILADHVIVTISLGCLKAQADTFFKPRLSAEKKEAIDKLGFGNIGKIFLEYEKAFWENDVSQIHFIWDDDSVSSVHTDQAQWLKHLQIFTVMRPKEKFGNVLIGWCPSDVADLIETMPEKELTSAITEHIRMFTGDPHIPPPKTVLRTEWRSNCFTSGVCSFLPVNVDALVMDVLAQPLVGTRNPNKELQVLFAGEATIKSLYGTVQGAWLSGHREAERLLQYYKETKPAT
ncbi:hypothetical protein C0J50_5533, partial [Silurus asotus]